MAAGLRVPRAVGDFLMLRAIRQSGGTAVAVTDEEMASALKEMGAATGLFVAPEGAAAWAGIRHLAAQGWIGADERVVLFNTGSGLKYIDALKAIW
jgi:threonine synthase